MATNPSSPTKLPSLSIGLGKRKQFTTMSPGQFLTSIPVIRRERTNLLFEEALDNEPKNIPTGFSRNGLRTPPHIRQAIQDAIYEYSVSKAVGDSSKTSSGDEFKLEGKQSLSTERRSSSSRNMNNDWSTEAKLAKEKMCKYLLTPAEKALANPTYQSPPSSLIGSSEDSILHDEKINALVAAADEGLSICSVHIDAEIELEANYDKYFSEKAKDAFKEKFRNSSRHSRIFEHVEDIPEELRTPRHMYLRDLHQRNLLPLPLILRKQSHSKGVYLPCKGIGDEYCLAVISVLDALPCVKNIDLSSNRLTDISLIPLALKLFSLKSLTYLNLSGNDVDESSRYLMDYLGSDECTLKAFSLDASDVDDIECADLATAMIKNKSIVSLSLCNNKVGEMELLNVVMPDLVTGGEAIGSMLEHNCTLTDLDLRWNSIRLGSAETLAASLQTNSTLKILKLGNNAIGEAAIERLGQSLKINKCLSYLDISYNALNPKAMSVLSNSLIYNRSLRELILDGNVLGSVGAQSFIGAIQRAAGEKRKLAISFNSCDCEKHDKHVFDPANPTGTWELDLADPYGQMVAEECFFLADHKSGCSILRMDYQPVGGPRSTVNLARSELKTGRQQRFNEIDFRAKSKEFNERLLEGRLAEACHCMQSLLQMFDLAVASSLTTKVVEKVQENWLVQVREGLCHEEDLADVLMFEMFTALFQIADEDGSGFVSYEELDAIFRLLGLRVDEQDLRRLRKEFDIDNSGQVDRDEFTNAMVQEFCVVQHSKGPVVERATGLPWAIPSSGKMTVEMMYKTEKPGIFNVMRNDMMEATIEQLHNAKTAEQRQTIFHHIVNSPYYFMNAGHAQMIFDEMNPGTDGALDLILEILPQIVDEKNVIRFLDGNLNELGKLALRVKIGQIYNAYVGNPTGHYLFDLKNKIQKHAAKKLSTISISESAYCEQKGVNTSQKGYYSSLRNETIDDISLKATGEWFAVCPHAGKFRCDFVSSDRPRQGTRPMSDHRFRRLVRQHLQLDELLTFREELGRCTCKSELDALLSATFSRLPVFFSIVHLKTSFFEFMHTSNQFYDRVVYPPERMRDFSRPNYSDSSRPATPADMKVGERPSADSYSPVFPLAYSKMILLQVLLPGHYFSVQQVIDILLYFQQEEYMRVQILLSLFGRLTDLENLGRIVDDLFTEDEKAETYHRLGLLNVLDPISPERLYRLDLRRWDHREMCKLLVRLAASEPGENWEGESYRWAKYDEPVPGWILPSSWAMPDRQDDRTGEPLDGPRNHGWLTLRYTSSRAGCVPSYAARRFLRNTRTLTGIVKLI